MRSGTTLAVLCALWTSAVPPISCAAKELSAGEVEALMEGHILVDALNNENGVPGLIAAFSVSAPRENIWKAFVDYDNFSNIFEGVKKLEVKSEDDQGATVEFWIDAVLADLNYTLYRKYERPNYKLTWNRTQGDLEIIEGSWEIIDSPRPEKKIVVYSSFVKVGRLVPTKLVRWGAMRKAEDMCKKLREWISDTDNI